MSRESMAGALGTAPSESPAPGRSLRASCSLTFPSRWSYWPCSCPRALEAYGWRSGILKTPGGFRSSHHDIWLRSWTPLDRLLPEELPPRLQREEGVQTARPSFTTLHLDDTSLDIAARYWLGPAWPMTNPPRAGPVAADHHTHSASETQQLNSNPGEIPRGYRSPGAARDDLVRLAEPAL